jgi:hypothetical protein
MANSVAPRVSKNNLQETEIASVYLYTFVRRYEIMDPFSEIGLGFPLPEAGRETGYAGVTQSGQENVNAEHRRLNHWADCEAQAWQSNLT